MLAHGARVRNRLPHSPQCNSARDSERDRDLKGQGYVLFMLYTTESSHVLISDFLNFVSINKAEFRLPVFTNISKFIYVISFSGEQVCFLRGCAQQSLHDVSFRWAHHIQMIGPHVSYHSMGCPYHFQLTDGLKQWVNRHTFNHKCLRPIVGRH